MLDHIFFDARFSKADPSKGKIVDIAAVRTDGKGKPFESGGYSSHIEVNSLDEVEKNTYKLNGYVESEWAESAIPLDMAITSMRNVILNGKRFDEKCVIVVHTSERFSPSVRDTLFPKRAWLDTAQIAWPLAYHGLTSGRGLDYLARHYSIPIESNMFSAESNVVVLMKVYWEMMRRMKTVLQGDNMLQSVTDGTTIDRVRKLFNF